MDKNTVESKEEQYVKFVKSHDFIAKIVRFVYNIIKRNIACFRLTIIYFQERG